MELALGAANSLGSTLRLEQDGAETRHEADWATRSFEGPLYYAARVSRGAWALRFVHHKLYLEDPPAVVESFAVSHGYNLLTLERSFAVAGGEILVGAGLVIAHPESSVRGRTYAGGYHLTGPSAAIGVARRIGLGGRLALVPDMRFTLSRAHVPIAGGEASVPNAAFHLTVGLEVRLSALK